MYTVLYVHTYKYKYNHDNNVSPNHLQMKAIYLNSNAVNNLSNGETKPLSIIDYG